MILLADGTFDAFNGDTVSTLTTAQEKMDAAIGSAYIVANRVAVFAMVIAIILVGISFVLGNSNKRDMSQNKTILTRVLIASAGIFGAVGIVSLVVGFTL